VSLAFVADEILLLAAHPRPSQQRRARLARLLAPTADWDTVIRLAERHGVAGLVYDQLHGAPVPPHVRDALAALARACVARNLRLRHELGRVLAAFSKSGVTVMPLKGPVLADLLYPAPLLRASGDLDVLVRGGDQGRAVGLLEALGYRPRPVEEQGADYHTIFTNDVADVELHHDIGERHVSRMDVEEIWASATAAQWGGHPIVAMASPDQLVYLAFHAAKDGLASLRSLVDIALLVERDRAVLPWAALGRRLRARPIAPMVYLALSEARALLGARVPDEFLHDIRPRHTGWWLAKRLFGWRGGVLHVSDELLVGPFMAVLMMLWEPTVRARLRHVRRNLLPSARLRGRWTSSSARASWLLSYPRWLVHAARFLLRQLATGSADRSPAAEFGHAEQPRPVLGPQQLRGSGRDEVVSRLEGAGREAQRRGRVHELSVQGGELGMINRASQTESYHG
jgi:hypothetical protein